MERTHRFEVGNLKKLEDTVITNNLSGIASYFAAQNDQITTHVYCNIVQYTSNEYSVS